MKSENEIREFITMKAGQISMCWEHVEKAGVCKSEEALNIVDEIMIFIKETIDEYAEKELNDAGILTGDDAMQFVKNMKAAERSQLPDKEVKRMAKNYQKMLDAKK